MPILEWLTRPFWFQQIKAAAALAGLKLKEPETYKHYEDNKKPEFLEKFASGKIPAFEGEDGFCLFEGTAIARYGKIDHLFHSVLLLCVPSLYKSSERPRMLVIFIHWRWIKTFSSLLLLGLELQMKKIPLFKQLSLS